MTYDENQARQRRDQSISLVFIETKMKLSRPIWLGALCDETRQDKDVTDRIGEFYAKNDTKLLWSIGSGFIYDENKTWQQRDRS